MIKNVNKTEVCKAIIIISMYFFCPFIISLVIDMMKITHKVALTFIFNFLLMLFFIAINYKDLKQSLTEITKNIKHSLKTIFIMYLLLLLVQIVTNAISMLILGSSHLISSKGLLPNYLDKWPILMSLNMLIIYPIIETIVFNKTFKDCIKNKWVFIICASIFFWLANLLSFDFNAISLVATMSCFTTSIVINYFYYKNNNVSHIILVKIFYNMLFLIMP